ERKRHPRNLRRGRRPSSSAAPLIASGEAFASTGAEPPWNRGAYGPRPWRGSAAGAVNVRGYSSTGAQRPFPLRIGPRGWGEAKTRDRRASWSVQIPAMGPDPSGAPTGGGARPPRSELLARLWPPHIASRAACQIDTRRDNLSRRVSHWHMARLGSEPVVARPSAPDTLAQTAPVKLGVVARLSRAPELAHATRRSASGTARASGS